MECLVMADRHACGGVERRRSYTSRSGSRGQQGKRPLQHGNTAVEATPSRSEVLLMLDGLRRELEDLVEMRLAHFVPPERGVATQSMVDALRHAVEEQRDEMSAILTACSDVTEASKRNDALSADIEDVKRSLAVLQGSLVQEVLREAESRQSHFDALKNIVEGQLNKLSATGGADESSARPHSEVLQGQLQDVHAVLCQLEGKTMDLQNRVGSLESQKSAAGVTVAADEQEAGVDKRDEVKELRRDAKGSDQGFPGIVTTKSQIFSSINLLVDEALHCPIEATMWDAAMFVGFDASEIGGTLLILVGLFWLVSFNAFTIVVMLKSKSFLRGSDLDLPSAETWRLTAAHDILNMDKLTHLSLARRVCVDDASLTHSTEQRAALEEIGEYLEPLPLTGVETGLIICSLMLLLWTMIVWREVKRALTFVISAWGTARRRESSLAWCSEQQMFSVNAITLPQVIFVTGVGIVRVTIALSLGFAGSLWLARERSITNLILNAAALSFLFDSGHIFFSIFVPVHIRVLMQSMKPLPVAAGKKLRSLQWRGFAMVTLLASAVVFLSVEGVMMFQGRPKVDEMVAIVEQLCNGHLDFVVGVHVPTGWAVTADTQTSIDAALTRSNAVRELVWMTAPIREAQLTDHSTSLMLLQDWLETDMKDALQFQRLSTGCHDSFSASVNDESSTWSIRSASGIPNASSCADLKPACSKWGAPLVRAMCPVTCGCRQPRSGLAWKTAEGGCPREECVATPQYRDALAALPCEDLSVDDLRRMPEWASYWQQVIDLAKSWAFYENSPVMMGMKQTAALLGCKILSQAGFWSLCTDRLGSSSLSSFCPVTCRCGDSDQWSQLQGFVADCPPSCMKSSVNFTGAGQ